MVSILLIAILTMKTALAQEDSLTVRSEGGGSTNDEAIHNARTKAVSSQVDAIVRLRARSRERIKNQITKDIEPFIIEHSIVQSSDLNGVYRAIVDVELDVPALVEKLVKLNVAKDFRYKPRVMIAITEKALGENSSDLSLTTQLAEVLIKTGFKVVSPESMGEIRSELIKGVSPERLAEIAESQKADILIGGNVDTKKGVKSSLLKNADLQPYHITGSIRAAHCETGTLYFSKNFKQNQSSTSLENARQAGLKQLLNPTNAKGIAKPLLAGILQPWAIQVAVGKSQSNPDLEASAPPTISVIAPQDLTVTVRASIQLRAIATDDIAVEGIRLWVNNIEIPVKDGEHIVSMTDSAGKQENTGASEYQINRLIALAFGENQVRIAVYDSDANQTEQGLTILRNVPKSSGADVQATIFTPSNESVAYLPFVQLSGEADGKERIVDVKVFANGTALPMARDLNLVRKQGPFQVDRRVPLRVGRNLIKLVAFSASGKTAERYVVVNRQARQYAQQEAVDVMSGSAGSGDVQITIFEPANASVVSMPAVKLSGEVTGKEEIVNIKVKVNGMELPIIRDINVVRKPKQNTYEIHHRLPLQMGRNSIRLIATTVSGETAEKYFVVDRVTAGDRPALQPAAPQITIYEPKSGLQTADASVNLRGEVFGENLSVVTVSFNGTNLIHESDAAVLKNTFPILKEIELAMGENEIRVFAETASGGSYTKAYSVMRVSPDAIWAFNIEIESPAAGEVVAQESVRVIGTVTGQSEISDVEVLINGIQTRDLKLVRKQKPENKPYKIDKVLHLAPGKNEITVVVRGEAGEKKHKFSVNRVLDIAHREAEADDELREEYNKYAVIIGISDYQETDIPDLGYARADAEAIYNKLIDPNRGGFAKENVWTLFDDQASLKNIKNTLGKLAQIVKPNDMVFMYYSGHGGVTPDMTGEEADGRRKYILPHDVSIQNLDATGLRSSELSLLLDRISANKFVFVMDCCFSGGQIEGGKLKSVSPANTPIGTDVYGQLSAAGRIVISASQPDQVSFETVEFGHGIFTHHLLEALDGKADFDTDKLVSLLETYIYVQREVAMSARKLGQIQQPKLMGNVSGSIILTRLP